MSKTRIVLAGRIREKFEDIIIKDHSNLKTLNINQTGIDRLNGFIAKGLESHNKYLYNKLKGNEYEKSVIERAWGYRSHGRGCSLEFANLICCFIENADSNLKTFSQKEGLTENDFEVILRGEEYKDISFLDESVLLNEERKQKGLRDLEQEHLQSIFNEKLALEYQGANFNQIPALGFDHDREFLVSDSYVDISYINRQELKTSNDHFVIEKEGLSYKRSRRSKAEVFTNFFSVEVVTESLVLRNEHLVLIGNPGVGKTTYAKWICHEWATGNIISARTPVYIPCRELPQSGENSIIEYLSRVYELKDPERISALLKSFSQKYQLILDGYDEASLEQRLHLERDLKSIHGQGAYFPFVLLTRPYALVDSPFKRIPGIYELIGFNEISRAKYIESYFSKVASRTSAKDFMAVVDARQVLRELSYNPLQLSYMVSIFSTDGGKLELNSIHSSYDLNDKALEYMVNYHAQIKGIARELFMQDIDRCKPFVADLELELCFVYHKKSTLDKNFIFAETLSKLGVGRLELNPTATSWSFYILNIHYQEYLATEYLGPQITKDSFLYLLGNPLYWHLAQMLMGYMVSHGNEDVLNEIFTTLRLDLGRALNHNSRLYFILLGELPAKLLNNIIREKEIGTLIDFYRWLHNDAVWNSLYFESLTKIYEKLDHKHKQVFEGLITVLVNGELQIPEKTDMTFTTEEITKLSLPHFLVHIIENLELYHNESLLKIILDKYIKLEILSQEYYQWLEGIIKKKETPTLLQFRAEEEIDNSRFHLLNILDQIENTSILVPHYKILWLALSTSTLHASIIARIIAKIRSSDFFVQELDKLLKSKKVSGDKLIMASLMCVGATAVADYTDNKEMIRQRLLRMKDALDIHLEKASQKTMKTHIIARTNYAYSIAQTDDIDLFPLLVWANYYNEIGNYTMSGIPVSTCDAIISSFFADITGHVVEVPDIMQFNSTILSMEIGPMALERQYFKFFSFFKETITTYSEELKTALSDMPINQGQYITDPLGEQLGGIPDTLNYPVIIKRFIEDIFSSSLVRYPYISRYYLLFLLSCDVPLYEKKYWDFIYEYLSSDKPDLSLVISIFYENPAIFLYESNLIYLGKVWRKLSSLIIKLEDYAFITGMFSEITVMAYRSIRLNYEVNGHKDPGDLIAPIADVLRMPLMIKHLYDDVAMYHGDDIEGLISYPLLALYIDDPLLMLGNDFSEILMKEDHTRRMKFFAELAQIGDFKAPVFAKGLGGALYQSFEKYCKIAIKEEYQVIPEVFKKLIRKPV